MGRTVRKHIVQNITCSMFTVTILAASSVYILMNVSIYGRTPNGEIHVLSLNDTTQRTASGKGIIRRQMKHSYVLASKGGTHVLSLDDTTQRTASGKGIIRRQMNHSYVPAYKGETRVSSLDTTTQREASGKVTMKLSYVPGIGRLGNRLFQYASTYGISRRSGRIHSVRKDEELFRAFTGITARFYPMHEKIPVLWENQSMIYSPGLLDLPSDRNMALCCYLQSWKYFYGFENEIKQQYRFKMEIVRKTHRTLLDIKMDYLAGRPRSTSKRDLYHQHEDMNVTYVGVHIRRHDIVRNLPLQKKGYIPATESYIRKAMSYYQQKYENVIFVMCSDGHAWCKKVFEKDILKKSVFLVTGGSPYEDLAILSSCNHSIITVGSFGWWSAWLAGGQVTYFSKWPAPGSVFASHFNSQDYYPPDWIPLE